MRDYLSSYFKPNTTQTAFSYTGNDLYIGYEVRFGEEYGGITYTNLASGNYKAFNFVNPIFRNFSTSYYEPKINTWLTSRDVTAADVQMGEKLYAGWMNTAGTTTNLTLTVQKYANGGAASGSPSTGGSVTCDSFVLFDLSPAAINTYLGSEFITASTYQYGVVVNYGGNQSAEFKIKLACQPRWTPVSLHFLNKLGGYDTMQFRLVNRRSALVERKSYSQMDWQYNSGAMTRYNANKVINPGNQTLQ